MASGIVSVLSVLALVAANTCFAQESAGTLNITSGINFDGGVMTNAYTGAFNLAPTNGSLRVHSGWTDIGFTELSGGQSGAFGYFNDPSTTAYPLFRSLLPGESNPQVDGVLTVNSMQLQPNIEPANNATSSVPEPGLFGLIGCLALAITRRPTCR